MTETEEDVLFVDNAAAFTLFSPGIRVSQPIPKLRLEPTPVAHNALLAAAALAQNDEEDLSHLMTSPMADDGRMEDMERLHALEEELIALQERGVEMEQRFKNARAAKIKATQEYEAGGTLLATLVNTGVFDYRKCFIAPSSTATESAVAKSHWTEAGKAILSLMRAPTAKQLEEQRLLEQQQQLLLLQKQKQQEEEEELLLQQQEQQQQQQTGTRPPSTRTRRPRVLCDSDEDFDPEAEWIPTKRRRVTGSFKTPLSQATMVATAGQNPDTGPNDINFAPTAAATAAAILSGSPTDFAPEIQIAASALLMTENDPGLALMDLLERSLAEYVTRDAALKQYIESNPKGNNNTDRNAVIEAVAARAGGQNEEQGNH